MQPSTDTASLHPALYFTDDMPIVKEDEYVFRYVATQLPGLAPGQMAIHLFQLLEKQPLRLIALFQNTLDQSFQLNDLVVLALSGDQLIARKTLSVEEIPVLLPMATLPLWLEFSEEDVFVDLDSLTDPVQLVFSNELLTDVQIDSSFSETERQRIRQIAFSHPAPPTDGWSLLPVSLLKKETSVEAIVLVRNPSDQLLTLDQLAFELVTGETTVAQTEHPTVSVFSMSEYAIRLQFNYSATATERLALRYLP
ncbi:SLAP domain-containing protein [Exiguobacterium sp. s193]|uniref:SLAP domain-containing protein n=1 Tax=Exiguobacterium sp. s193 TaxID=2751207 RepID=UPI001BEA8C1F|nr:SLAP domain-containing protein [Exiguobacterium sp. s193]